eukprot:CAMPEP_0116541998 /NCGR_PEP_ID=MMETSP0397-20121206/778_1 /TAXON_ID=216820 /ORGANISM="Cyclophora tenuis, Strain ECT3854" /LENGTH=351 /DNA_ID=CAMNT_0004065971 /DNA_START=37 /DNA_END=1092 /DNA_ORIENTATION=+
MWCQSSGLVGTEGEEGDVLYEKVLGTKVCRSRSIVGCIALVWRQISNVVEELHRIPASQSNQTILLALPDCDDLYQYHNLVTLQATMIKGSEMCNHLGTVFDMRLHHPKYKNAPRLLDPARHSPFPCIGLHFEGKSNAKEDSGLQSRRVRRRLPVGEAANDVRLKESRSKLEILFNSPAATSFEDTVAVDHDIQRNDNNLSTRSVRIATERWMSLSLFEGAADKALRYAGTEGYRWTITKSIAVEEIYSDIWLAIATLQEAGAQLEQRLSPAERPEVITSMFITIKYCAYNANTWRKFAISVNGALKRITNGQMFVEVFHPEYTGKQVSSDGFRRSPLPTIQICYRLNQQP